MTAAAAGPAPIALFSYNRPEKLGQTLGALAADRLAPASSLTIYNDGPKTPADERGVAACLEIACGVSGFAQVNVVERGANLGLARNIVDGISRTLDAHGRVVVVEDDMLVSPYFLTFMNDALEAYEGERGVWHVAGWNHAIDASGLEESVFSRTMLCWGWATWSDRWASFAKEPERLLSTWNRSRIYAFNVDNSVDYWQQVRSNASGTTDTWAIFWYATIFENEGLCLTPARSLVQSIGFGDDATHCKDGADQDLAARDGPVRLPTHVREDPLARERLRSYLLARIGPVARARLWARWAFA